MRSGKLNRKTGKNKEALVSTCLLLWLPLACVSLCERGAERERESRVCSSATRPGLLQPRWFDLDSQVSQTVTLLVLLLFLALFCFCLGVLAPPVTAEPHAHTLWFSGLCVWKKSPEAAYHFFSSLHYTFSSLCVLRDRGRGWGVERGGGKEAGGGETLVIGK